MKTIRRKLYQKNDLFSNFDVQFIAMQNIDIILNFLKDLEKNNNREWFNEHKNRYTEAQEAFTHIVEEIIAHIATFDPEIGKLDAKKCVFRIYRDTRFSKDKTPYKTNFGASFFMGQSKGIGEAGYYLHLQPGKSFIAAGLYHPAGDVLKSFRKEISYNREAFLAIIEDKNFKKNFTLEGEKLVKIPQGFEKEDPMAEFLKYKEMILRHSLTDVDLHKKDLTTNIGKLFEIASPFNRFVKESIDFN